MNEHDPEKTSASLDERWLELERFKAEQEARLDTERLSLDAENARRDRRWQSNPAMLSAAISFAAVLVSGAQVWVANITKDKELALSKEQSQRESQQRAEAQQRQYDLERAKLVVEHPEVFAGVRNDETRLKMLLSTLYTPDVADALVKGGAVPTAASAQRPPDSLTTEKRLQLAKVSGDGQVIPLGGWKNFVIRVTDDAGAPVKGAKIAWEQRESGSYAYVGETDDSGTTSATNLVSSSSPGSFKETASLVERSTRAGFTDARNIIKTGSAVTFDFRQE